nr:hypothetical protein [Vibrio anguillarum]
RADNKSSFDKMSLNLNKIISELKADGLPDEAIDEIVRKNYPKSFWVKQSNLFDTDSTDGNNT